MIEGGGSIIHLQRHDLSINNVVSGIALGNVDPWVHADCLGQSFLESLLEGARHLLDEGLFVLL